MAHDRFSVSPNENSLDYRRAWGECVDHILRWLQPAADDERMRLALHELAASDVVGDGAEG